MRILYIAPISPPITGHSIAADVLLVHLELGHQVEVVNLSTGSRHDGSVTFIRVLRVLQIISRVFIAARRVDVLYLTISESLAGNIKDLVIYAVIGKMIENMVVHLHGGSFGKQILERSPLLRILNNYFIFRVNAVVVSGPSHVEMFSEIVPSNKINIIPNFAQSFLFINQVAIERKFHCVQKKINVLYLSGMTDGKGYLRLLHAYEKLNVELKSRINLDFAGKFDSQDEERQFSERIRILSGVTYHGIVDNNTKAKLFARAHIFCLPTSFMEGQPISILEAYAAGCIVLTTPQPGILDIFGPNTNGFIISIDDVDFLRKVIETYFHNIEDLRKMAIHNRRVAEEKYCERTFCERAESALKIASNNCLV